MPRHLHALWRWVSLGHISVHDQHVEVSSQTPYAAAYIMCQHCVDFTCLTSSLSIFKRLFILLQTLEYTDPHSKVHGDNWGPSGADRTQVGPMLAPWTLLSGEQSKSNSMADALAPGFTRASAAIIHVDGLEQERCNSSVGILVFLGD